MSSRSHLERNSPIIIGVSGNAGVGKDYITKEYLVPAISEGKSYMILAFADHFKYDAIVKDGLSRDKVFGRKDSATRIHLQHKGTEKGRMVYGENVWINILHETILQHFSRGIEYFFITDCRFPNEVQYVKDQNGIVIKISAPDREEMNCRIENVPSHISERGCKMLVGDFVIDNSIGKDVKMQISKLLSVYNKTLKLY